MDRHNTLGTVIPGCCRAHMIHNVSLPRTTQWYRQYMAKHPPTQRLTQIIIKSIIIPFTIPDQGKQISWGFVAVNILKTAPDEQCIKFHYGNILLMDSSNFDGQLKRIPHKTMLIIHPRQCFLSQSTNKPPSHSTQQQQKTVQIESSANPQPQLR